jgi:hypothetical protein
MSDWFHGWVARHIRRHVTRGLPNAIANSDYYDAWRVAFERAGIDEKAADEASILLATRKHAKWEHFPALYEIAVGVAGRVAPGSTEGDRLDARDCKHCGGMGTVGVTEPAWNAVWSAFCSCRLGRRMLDSTRAAIEKDRTGKRPIDLDHVLRGVRFRVVLYGEERIFKYSIIGDHHAQNLPARAARRVEDARRDHPRALPARPAAAVAAEY